MVEQEREQILKNALNLPLRDRTRLVEELISSLDIGRDEEVELAWEQEIQRRLGEIDRGEVQCVPWEQVRERFRRRRDAA